MDEEWIKRHQAKAMEELLKDLAKPDPAADLVRAERRMFGSVLAAARLKKRLSQAELAAELGTKQSYISRLENGKGNPNLDTLLRIAKVLNVNIVVE